MDTITAFPAKRALLIGIGRYQNLSPLRQLRGPLPDVQALAGVVDQVVVVLHRESSMRWLIWSAPHSLAISSSFIIVGMALAYRTFTAMSQTAGIPPWCRTTAVIPPASSRTSSMTNSIRFLDAWSMNDRSAT